MKCMAQWPTSLFLCDVLECSGQVCCVKMYNTCRCINCSRFWCECVVFRFSSINSHIISQHYASWCTCTDAVFLCHSFCEWLQVARDIRDYDPQTVASLLRQMCFIRPCPPEGVVSLCWGQALASLPHLDGEGLRGLLVSFLRLRPPPPMRLQDAMYDRCVELMPELEAATIGRMLVWMHRLQYPVPDHFLEVRAGMCLFGLFSWFYACSHTGALNFVPVHSNFLPVSVFHVPLLCCNMDRTASDFRCCIQWWAWQWDSHQCRCNICIYRFMGSWECFNSLPITACFTWCDTWCYHSCLLGCWWLWNMSKGTILHSPCCIVNPELVWVLVIDQFIIERSGLALVQW